MKLSPTQPLVYLSRGLALAAAGKHGEAIADFTRAIELKPELAKAYQARAASYEAQGSAADAQRDQKRAQELAAATGR